MKKSRVLEETKHSSVWPGVWLMQECDSRYAYSRGAATTRYGIVTVYMQADGEQHTRMSFVHNGREWTRTFARTFSERGLLIMAGKFAREVVEA